MSTCAASVPLELNTCVSQLTFRGTEYKTTLASAHRSPGRARLRGNEEDKG